MISNLTLGPRPKPHQIANLHVDGVVTLLRLNEGARQIEEACRVSGVRWKHYPLMAMPWLNRYSPMEDFLKASADVAQFLHNGARIFMHCASGIHRTGMVAWGTLRLLGLTFDQAKAELTRLRPITLVECGDEQWQLIEAVLFSKGAMLSGGAGSRQSTEVPQPA